MNKTMLAFQGPKGNWQAPGAAITLTPEQLERWAGLIRAPKRNGQNAAIFRVGANNRKLEMLYRWHVGEGFSHAEGWWVEVNE